MLVMASLLLLLAFGNVFAEETVGCPHDVGKGNLKIRSKIAFIQAQKCYSDEVWKALHNDSPYSEDYDQMVDLPDEWHQKVTKINLGLEYGIIDGLSAGVFLPYVIKDVKRQVWSKTKSKTVWKEIQDNGPDDIWVSAKYVVYSNPKGWLNLDWEDGILLAVAYKPSINSDEKIKNGIGTGTNDLKFVVLAHPHFTESFFLCSDIWYQYKSKVKDIEGFSKSGWDLGDKFAYRGFLGYEFPTHKFVVVGGPQGWVAQNNKDIDGNDIEDSNRHSHGVVVKFRWQPFGDEDAGSIDLGVQIPYANKNTFAPAFVPTICGRVKF